MEQKTKFRIMVIERNDGVKMYHPQVYIPVEVKYNKNFWGKIKSRELVYGWRSFKFEGKLRTTCDDGLEHGVGSSDIEDAKEEIRQYKLDMIRRQEQSELKVQNERNMTTKTITFIEAE